MALASQPAEETGAPLIVRVRVRSLRSDAVGGGVLDAAFGAFCRANLVTAVHSSAVFESESAPLRFIKWGPKMDNVDPCLVYVSLNVRVQAVGREWTSPYFANMGGSCYGHVARYVSSILW